MVYVTQFVFFGIPLAAVLFFIISLYRYCSARKKNKMVSGTFSAEQIETRKILLIVASIVAGTLVVVIGSIYILLLMAVANM